MTEQRINLHKYSQVITAQKYRIQDYMIEQSPGRSVGHKGGPAHRKLKTIKSGANMAKGTLFFQSQYTGE
jgi:2-keto-4-pentenoate hydratase